MEWKAGMEVKNSKGRKFTILGENDRGNWIINTGGVILRSEMSRYDVVEAAEPSARALAASQAELSSEGDVY